MEDLADLDSDYLPSEKHSIPISERVLTDSNHTDSNYADIFIIWDRLFRTFQPELKEEKVVYGLTSNITTFNPIKIAFHEWIAMFSDAFSPGLTLGQRLQYFWRPPGWSHDGSRKGSKALKAEYIVRHPDAAGMPGLAVSPQLSDKEPGPL